MAPVNYFFALFANALCIATHVKLHVAPAEKNYAWLCSVSRFPWPSILQQHFTCRSGRRTAKEIRTSEDERAACVKALADHFSALAAHHPHEVEHFSKIDLCLNALDKIVKKQRPSGNQFADLIQGVAEIFDPEERQNTQRSRDLRLTKTDLLIEKLLPLFLKRGTLPPHIFGNLHLFALRLSSPVTVNELYYNSVFGPYYIVRKARSAIVDAPRDRDLIVRDMIWVRPLEEVPSASGIRSDDPATPSNALGYYISALDEQVFEITNIALREGLLMIDAVAFLDGTDTKSICAYLPFLPLDSRQNSGFASIIGSLSTEQRRTGAWSAHVSRPDLDEETVLSMHFAMVFFADCFKSDTFDDKVREYDAEIDEVYWAFANQGHCGALFSSAWLQATKETREHLGVKREQLFERIEAFENCFSYSKKSRRALDTFVQEKVKTILSDENEMDDELLAALLTRIYKEAEHTAITPSIVGEKEDTFHYFANPAKSPAIAYSKLKQGE